MSGCLFCKIAKKEIPAEIVYENAETVAFLDIHPRAPGHTMVIAKHHSASLLDLPEEKIGPLFLAVKRVTQMVEDALVPHGFTIGINHGRVSGQAVAHLHVHILPRFEGDRGGSIHSVVENPPRESLQEIGERIRSQRKV